MTRKSFVILAIISYIFLTIYKIDAQTQNNKKSISEEIINDEEICATKAVFRGSRYAKSCENIKFPIVNETLNATNSQKFLCLGLYDRTLRICHLDSQSKLGKDALPKNTDAFDLRVKKLFPKDSTNIVQFCQNWNNTYPPLYKKIASYVVQLETDMKKFLTCLKICTNFNGQFEPLCAVLASIDEISNNTPVPLEKSQPESQAGETKKAVENVSKAIDAGQNPSVANAIAKEREDNENKKAEATTIVEKDTVKGSTPLQKNETRISVPVDHSPPLEQTRGEISEANAKKSRVIEGVAPQPQTVNNGGGSEKVDTLKKTVKDTPKSLAGGEATLDRSDTKNSRIDAAQAGDDKDPGIPGDSEEETEKISTLGKEQIDQNTDIISEHTQDEDSPGGGSVLFEDPNEIEPPIMPALNEDINESSALPSEKQEYLPRVPNDDDSHFFGYVTVIGVICIAGYVGYHNKQKILAMVLEGRRSRGGRGRRRPSTANYRKLDCTLEEAVTSQCNSNVTHVIY